VEEPKSSTNALDSDVCGVPGVVVACVDGGTPGNSLGPSMPTCNYIGHQPGDVKKYIVHI